MELIAPLRMARPDELAVRGGAYLDARCFPAGHFLDRLAARALRLAGGEPAPAAGPPPVPAGAAAEPSLLTWVDVPVPGGKGKPRTLGGVRGPVALTGLPAGWLPWLVLGRHLHAGASTSYGFGRFRIAELAGTFPEPFRPARSALERAATTERLEEALDHVLERSEAAGADGVAPRDFAEGAGGRLGRLAGELAEGRYRPTELAGVLLPKDDGGVRPLAIPTVRDRVAQRAVGQVLAEAVDTLLEDCSYAYRKGFSRAGAARAVERAYAAGYRYVLDADIEAFFDSVEHRRLFAKLQALWPLDPVVELLRAWVAAPVVFDGRTIERPRGLPQGSPVAPLLANLYLDELDDEVLGEGFRLVRYADDFVVLARDLEEARRARETAAEALADLGLALNVEETAIRSFDRGFSYLGYLFVKSLVLEEKDDEEELAAAQRRLLPEDVPEVSWLARVPFARLRELVAETGREGKKPRRRVVARPLAAAEPADAPRRRPLYVSSPTARLRLDGGSLVVEEPGGEPRRLPLSGLSHLTFTGHVRATTPVLLALARQGVPSFFCHRSGELYASLGPAAADWTLWLEQARRAEEPETRLRFAQEVVAAKLHNQATLAVRFGWQGAGELAGELRGLAESALNQTALDEVLGHEGRGSALYFSALAASLPAGWGFTGRRRQPPPDPVNALLSFGYTLLYAHATTALVAAGLNPRIGLFHTARGTHNALASDLVEEMRWLVEALTWSLIGHERATPADFEASPDGRYPCLMRRELRERYLHSFEGRLHTRFTPAGEEATTYRAFLADQARHLVRLVRGEDSLYRPLRLHA